MATEEQKRLVLDKIDESADEIVGILRELVQIPSISLKYPGVDQEQIRGGESRCNQAVAHHLHEFGCEVDLWDEEPDRANCVGTIKGSGGGKSLILNGHIDTVVPGDHDEWKWNDPYSGKVEDGRLYGLGSCDMKGGITAQLGVAMALNRCGIRLKGDLFLESVLGEETMDHNAGTTATIRRGYKADAAIVVEPTGTDIIPTGSGMFFTVVNVSGVAAHPGDRHQFMRAGGKGNEAGVNAVEKGALMLAALQRLEEQWGFTKKHPLFKPGYFTIHPGVIVGGPPGPLVPYIVSTFCRIECIIWYPPQDTQETIKAEITEYLNNAAKLDLWLAEHPPEIEWRYCWPAWEVNLDHPIIQTCANAYHRTAQDYPSKCKEVSIHGSGGACDASFLNSGGIPAVVFGPGGRNAHQCNESISIEDLIFTTKALALTAMEWCGTD